MISQCFIIMIIAWAQSKHSKVINIILLKWDHEWESLRVRYTHNRVKNLIDICWPSRSTHQFTSNRLNININGKFLLFSSRTVACCKQQKRFLFIFTMAEQFTYLYCFDSFYLHSFFCTFFDIFITLYFRF